MSTNTEIAWPVTPRVSYQFHIVIVGLNVAPKGAHPFSRGKQVVPRKQVVPHRTQLPTKTQTTTPYSKLTKSAFSAIESIEATDVGGEEHKTVLLPPPPLF